MAVLIIFPADVFLQTVINVIIVCIGGHGLFNGKKGSKTASG